MIKALAGRCMETGAVVGFMAGLAAAVLICVLYHSIGRQTVATVNITGLINEFVQYESAQNYPPEKVKKDVRNFGRSLERDISRFAKKHHVILLPKEAVIAGTVDYTREFRKEIAAKNTKNIPAYPDRG